MAAVKELIGGSSAVAGTVGVVTPLRAQADATENMLLDDLGGDVIRKLGLRVGTVHGMQGSEADRMIISLGLDHDSPRQRLRFVEDAHLFNVMITRARREQWVVTSVDPDRLPPGLLKEYLEYSEHPPEPSLATGADVAWIRELGEMISQFGLKVLYGYREQAGRSTWLSPTTIGRWRLSVGCTPADPKLTSSDTVPSGGPGGPSLTPTSRRGSQRPSMQ